MLPVPGPSDLRRVIDLAVAAAPTPVSIERLLGWNLARPSDLWTVLSAMKIEGLVNEAVPGQFTAPSARRDDVVAQATADDWNALMASTDGIAWALEAASAAAAERRFAAATCLLRAPVSASNRATFPDGDRGWLAVVLQALRVARAMYGLPRAILEEAIGVAVAHGDIGAQGVL